MTKNCISTVLQISEEKRKVLSTFVKVNVLYLINSL